MHWIARPKDEDQEEPATPAQAIQRMRDNMGFPNHNLCTVEIHTKFETIMNGDNEIGLWRYYRRDTQYETGRPALSFSTAADGSAERPIRWRTPASYRPALRRRSFQCGLRSGSEKKYPNGVNDCWTALKHVYDHARSTASTKQDCHRRRLRRRQHDGRCLLMDRDRGTHMVALQVPMYAAVTFLGSKTPGYRFSIDQYEFDPSQKDQLDPRVAISRPKDEDHDDEITMGNLYFDDPENSAWRLTPSPLMEPDFTGMPTCLSIDCEFDGLRIQDELYAKGSMRPA